MAPRELTLAELKQLYDVFVQADPWRPWHQGFLTDLQWVQGLSLDTLSDPGAQQRLWGLAGIASIGQGEHLDVHGAFTDPAVVEAIGEALHRRWPEEPNARGRAIQAAYDKILDLVHPHHCPQRPQAKLGRMFMALVPTELHAAFSYDSQKHVRELVLGTRKGKPLELAVLVRGRLRHALGEEGPGDVMEHVRRATFCWWLHEGYERFSTGEIPDVAVGGSGPEPEPVEPIALLPVERQRMGIAAVNGYVEGYRAVVVAARSGATPEDIVETMRADLGFEKSSPKSCRQVFNRVRQLGFLEHREGLWYPSDEGERLVEEDPPDLLVQKLLSEHFGLAHLLRILEEQGPIAKPWRNIALRAVYPAWTSDFMPTSLAAWVVSLGLAAYNDAGRQALTGYGRSWAKRLPAELQLPPLAAPTLTEPGDDAPVEVAPSERPTLAAILHRFHTDPALAAFVFSDAQIRALHVAWHFHERKRFVILSGLSGTGKTALLVHYARVYTELMGLPVDAQRAVVAVSPDWRDPTGLLGYYNALHADPTFQREPTLQLLLAAARNPHLPYFLVLDEMNLARVEQYFAPFLSAMETGEPLHLHAQDEAVNGVPPRIPWPKNLYVGGTVNMDETTHPFSDKVLDRAFVLEFWDVALETFLARRATSQRDAQIEQLLVDANGVLTGIRRHFGYRTAGEVLDFLDHARALGAMADDGSRWVLADQAVFSKVLPRLRGEETPALHDALVRLRELCAERKMTRCVAKLNEMRERLTATGVTRFYA